MKPALPFLLHLALWFGATARVLEANEPPPAKCCRGGTSEIGFASRTARFVRVQCQQCCLTPTQVPGLGYAIRELQVFD